jgi:hypothetical protein
LIKTSGTSLQRAASKRLRSPESSGLVPLDHMSAVAVVKRVHRFISRVDERSAALSKLV